MSLTLLTPAFPSRDRVVAGSIRPIFSRGSLSRMRLRTHLDLSPRNLILAATDADEFAWIEPHLAPMEFMAGDSLGEAGSTAEWVWFVESGMVSLMTGGATNSVAAAIVGSDGFVGWCLALQNSKALHTAEALSEGRAFRMSAAAFREGMEVLPVFRQRVFGAVSAGLEQGLVLMASAAGASLPGRLATLLLQLNASGESIFTLRHADLARLLGTRRASVTDALHILEGEGGIRSTRSMVVIINRGRLEALAKRLTFERGSRVALSNLPTHAYD